MPLRKELHQLLTQLQGIFLLGGQLRGASQRQAVVLLGSGLHQGVFCCRGPIRAVDFPEYQGFLCAGELYGDDRSLAQSRAQVLDPVPASAQDMIADYKTAGFGDFLEQTVVAVRAPHALLLCLFQRETGVIVPAEAGQKAVQANQDMIDIARAKLPGQGPAGL